jgi:hypothetical protein
MRTASPPPGGHRPRGIFDSAYVRFGSQADITVHQAMSALPPKADKQQTSRYVCFVPIAT